MSAKLLYSLSDDNPNLQKQLGCMNGFLQLFDRHHFVNSRGAISPNNRILPPGENRHHGGGANGTSKKAKGKHSKVIKTQGNSESSRISVSSSSCSTTMSSQDCEWGIKNEQSPFGETRFNQPYSSRYQQKIQSNVSQQFHKKHNVHDLTSTSPSPIRTAPREEMIRHVKKHTDSPRPLQPSKTDNSRLVARNESFRSASSSQSAPISPLRKKKPDEQVRDTPRVSYDGREMRDSHTSSLKLRDLPRLSLDSRQRTIKESVRESRDDLVLRHSRRETQIPINAQYLPEEPASYRSPSNIVAKLMGLETLPDCSPSLKSQQDNSSICGSSDFLSKSSRTIDDSKVIGVLYSPRNNCRESKTPRAKKDKLEVKPKPSAKISLKPPPWTDQDEQPASSQVSSKHHEVSPNRHKHTLTVYEQIEKRMNDLDFKKSGKDLRALKQILESMHGEKSKLLIKKEIWSSDCESQSSCKSSTYMSHKHCLREPASQHQDHIGQTSLTDKESKFTKDNKSRDRKPGKLVRDSKKEAAFAMQDLPLKSLHQIRIGTPAKGIKDAAQNKITKYTIPTPTNSHDPSHQTHSGEKTPRPKAAPKSPRLITKIKVPSPVAISKTVSSNGYSHIPASTFGSRTKQQKPDANGLRSQAQKLRRKSYILQGMDDHSKVISTDSFLSDEKTSELAPQMQTALTSNDQPNMKYDNWQLENNNKNAEEFSGDTSLEELAIAVREQPSPVSVLDANFYGDESLSPVKKKTTAFTDYETEPTYTEAEWKDIDSTYTRNSKGPSFSYGKQDMKIEDFSQAVRSPRQLDYGPGRSAGSLESPRKKVNLEKAYVSEILAASGLLDDISFNAVNFQVGRSQEAVNPNLFLVLEQTKGSRYLSEKKTTDKADTILGANERHRRRLLFDTVNEILSQKLSSTGLGPRPRFMKQILKPRTDSLQVLQEIFTEINQLQDDSFHQSINDEDDFLTTIIGKDLSHATGNWADVGSEIPGLVLDVERLIFKDLIGELVHEAAKGTNSTKRHQ